MTGNGTPQLPDAGIIENTWPVAVIEHPDKVAGHDACIISTRDGRYVLKTCGSWMSKEDVERCTQALSFLTANGFGHSPRIVPARNGSLFANSGGRFSYLAEFVPGKEPAPSPENYESFGTLAAKLHSIVEFPFKCPIAVKSLRAEMIDYAGSVDFGPEYAEMVRSLPDLGALPSAMIHADLGLGNTVLGPDGRIIILDWDESGTGPRILDAAYPLIMVFLDENLRFHADLSRAFYTSYFRGIALTAAETDRFFEAALFYALWFVRFGDPQKRWQRIKHALEHRAELLSAVKP